MHSSVDQPLLRIEDLSVDFLSAGVVSHAVKQVSVTVHRGEIVALVGESGSGKSVTALSILKLIPQPPASYPSGSITLLDNGMHNLLEMQPHDLQKIRGNRISMIFQEPMTSLNPVMKCGEQVMEVMLLHKELTHAEAKRITIEWFGKVQLPFPEKMFDRYPHQLSGGQKQRVMIAMAMCCEPALLICDEPTTALDVTVQQTILQLIKNLQRAQGMGVIFITHDLGVVAGIADRVAIMYRGSIVETGTTEEIFKNAQHPYTKALIACKPSQHSKHERLPTVADFLQSDEQHPPAPVQNKPVTPGGDLIMEAKNLVVEFPNRSSLFGKPLSFVRAVDDVSFVIERNETLGLVGESGCGKTTLGRTLLRLIEPASGTILFENKALTSFHAKELFAFRKKAQLIFQDPYSSLNPRINIGSAIAEPMKVSELIPDRKKRKERVAELLQLVDLSPDMMNRYPHEFSGGQRQRIVIARALSLEPSFIICDESVSALDVSVQAQVLNLLNDLKSRLGLTMLFISHDLSVIHYMCDRIMVMKQGRIVETGTAEEVYRQPQTAYTRSLIEAIPVV